VRSSSLAPLLQYTGVGTNSVLVAPPVGPIAYFATSYVNANSTKTSGFDLELNYHHRFDWFDFKSAAMWNFEYKYSIEVDGITYQLAGTHGPSGTGGDTGNPRSHVQWVNTAAVGALSITGTMNFTSSFNVTDPVSEALSSSGFVPQENCLEALSFAGAAVYDFTNQVFAGQIPNQSMCRVAHYITFDLYARYDLSEHLNIHGAVQNVFNEGAPKDWETYGGALALVPWNPSNNLAGAVGPAFMIGATYRF
jgi:iron complex outermembrane receptor protein